jgi:hypothetical protein
LLLQAAGRAFVSLRGNLTDQLREINFCRVRLGELMQAFSDEETTARARLLDTPPPAPAVRAPARVRPLLPAGCTTLEQAVIHFARDITPDDLQALDRQVQALIQQQFRALIHVCLTSANLMSNVRIAMEQEVARAVEARIGGTDAASQFFEHFPTDEEAAAELVSAFDEAVPDVTVSKSGPRACEIAVLAVPPTPAGERLLSLARQALPDVVLTAAPGSDEIIVYREAVQVPMADLANVGPAAQEAYRQMTAVEHFTPHSRVDIAFRCEPVAS